MTDKIINEGMRIGGKTVHTDNKIDVIYPFTGKVIGTVPAGTAEHAQKAFDIAANYKPNLSRYDRQKILQKTAETLVERKEQISDLISLESGLSKQDTLYEVGRAFDVFSLTAQLCIQDDGEIYSCDLTPHGKQRKIFTIREPLNTISAITPFNHPLNMVAHKIAPSIATNNCTVCKQTELTPLTAMLLADILYECGLPPEMFSILTGWPEDIGNEVIKNKNIDLITFTGSVGVGKLIAENAGYKRTVLELGGNDPLIVLSDLDDDDLNKAADLAIMGATKNSGQRCTAVKRILVQESVADGNERFLFEMATGTGKTLTSAAIIKLFLRSGNAKRVLFLVDRLELEEQSREAFNDYLKTDYTTVIYKENRNDWRRAEIMVTTVQSLMVNNKYRSIFSPTDFDLVISDEAAMIF